MLLEILSTNRSSSCLSFSRWEFESSEQFKKVLNLESGCSRNSLEKALVTFLNTRSGWGNGTEGIHDFKLTGKSKIVDWKGYKVIDPDLKIVLDADFGESYFETVAKSFFAQRYFCIDNAAQKLRVKTPIIEVA